MNRTTWNALVLSFLLVTSAVAGDYTQRKSETRMKVKSEFMKQERLKAKKVAEMQQKVRLRNSVTELVKDSKKREVKEALSELDIPVTKPATNVSEFGFTANWKAVKDAEGYGVYSVLTHTAAIDENYKLLDEDFSNIDFGTMEEPKMGNIQEYLDEYTNRCDWAAVAPAYAVGMLGLYNGFASLDMPGMLFTPFLDLSHDSGKFVLDMTVYGAGVTSIGIGHFTGDIEEPVEIKNSSIAPGSQTLHFEFTKGSPDSYLLIVNGEGDGITFIDNISLSQKLKAGESTTLFYSYGETEETSYLFFTPGKKATDGFGFRVGAFAFSPDGDIIASDLSEPQAVIYETSVHSVSAVQVKVYVSDNLNIELAEPAYVEIYTPAGVCVKTLSANAGNNEIVLPSRGVYLVKVDKQIYKVVK